jgi:ATP-dependent helicase IRC3
MMFTSRPYQEATLDAICTAYDQGWRQQLLSLATGTGKTATFSMLYEKLKSRLPGKTLILAHTEELISQSIATMHAVNPSLHIDKEMAEYKADPTKADVVIASVASLGRLNTSRLAKYDMAQWDKVIVDECQHTVADSYMRVLEAFGVLESSTNKLLLGFTATPFRADGRALGEVYKKIVYSYSLRQAITDKWLVPIRGYRVVTQTDLSGVKVSDGDLNNIELEATINTPQRNKAIVDAWMKFGDHRPTLVFAAGIEHARALSEAFTGAGVSSKAVWGSDDSRSEKLREFRDSKIQVLINCNLLTEGVDLPRISCIILARPTKSGVLFTQMVGRSTRLYPEKTDSIVLDVVDICGSHSLCTLPMLMGMPANLDLQGHGIVEAVELIEAMQEENPNVDFTKLKLLDNITQFIEQVNLFEVRFPKEVEENSEFRWVRAIDGGFVMRVPNQKADCTGVKPGRVRIYENVIGEWEIDGRLKDGLFHGVRKSIEEAFACADQQIRQRAPASVCLVNRSAAWMTKPATAAQMKMLNRLYKGKAWPEGFTQGQASHFIDQRIGGKK